MNIIEFELYIEGTEKDIEKLAEQGFTKQVNLTKPVYKKKVGAIEIIACTKFNQIRMSVSELNTKNSIRRYEDIKEIDIKEMFNETKLSELIENFNQPIDYIEIKTFENHIDRLKHNGWSNEMIHNCFTLGDGLTYLKQLDSGYWIFQDEEKPVNLHSYLRKLSKLGFSI
ncbi:hypothetical protein [Bacillus sp. FSL K6-2865]|uniref:hypothetical protein n=1 Tax=Bacillus sp. FSL K6-2865 TaxID=2975295 RepID=UPI0032559E5B